MGGVPGVLFAAGGAPREPIAGLPAHFVHDEHGEAGGGDDGDCEQREEGVIASPARRGPGRAA
ncbi:hypothetical protein GCM10020295_57090 [Streptomyces cinereospinus]